MLNSFGEILSDVAAYMLDVFYEMLVWFLNKFFDALYAAVDLLGLKHVLDWLRDELSHHAGLANEWLGTLFSFTTVLESWGIPVIPMVAMTGVYFSVTLGFSVIKIILKLIPTIG